MHDNLTLYRLKTGELIVAEAVDDNDTTYNVKGPHSIVEEPSHDGGRPRVMLQPSIPHDEDAIVEINKSLVALKTEAPENVRNGYRQALSNIVIPNQGVQTGDNITNIAAGLQP
ncbi:MAG TPA: hypothetical protein EYP35_04520 [Desulfobacterales bacterium]|nr:hypothetical protein [Desulfobacterales bacterium]